LNPAKRFLLNLILIPFIFLGCGFITSIVFGVLYRISDRYCLDCNHGLGLVFFGFMVSGILLPVMAVLLNRFFDNSQKRKRKNEELR